MRGIYLLHFAGPYKHAGHYMGYADDIARRVHEHAAGGSKASPLVRAALGAGSRLQLARVWPEGDRTRERGLKNQGGHARRCPVCWAARKAAR